MIQSLIRGASMDELVIQLLATTFVVFCTFPVHEFAHAWAATRLGDDTARLQGRLTLNPFAHLTLPGTLLIFLAGFGYAKPVPVNMRRFRNPKRDMALTAAAGPISNLLMATVFIFIMRLILAFWHGDLGKNIAIFFYFAGFVNISLAVFNLLPIPPLDGSRIATLLIPDKYYYQIMKNEQIIMIVLFALILTNVLTTPLMFLTDLVYGGIDGLVSLLFRLMGV